MLFSKLDADEQLHVVASQLWRQLFETLSVIGVTDNEFRNMLLTSGPALSLSLSNSVKKVVSVLEAPMHWSTVSNSHYTFIMDLSRFSFLGSLGAALVCIRSAKAREVHEDDRAVLLGEGENARLKLTKGASLGIGLMAAVGTLWCAYCRYLDDNRVHRDYHVILEQIVTFLSGSDESPSLAASVPSGQLESAIARRCKEIGLSGCSVEEALNVLVRFRRNGAALKENTLRDLLLRANILEKVVQLRCLLENFSSVPTSPTEITFVKTSVEFQGADGGCSTTKHPERLSDARRGLGPTEQVSEKHCSVTDAKSHEVALLSSPNPVEEG